MNGQGFGYLALALFAALALFYIYVGWRIFEKANQPGWASLIPIYNMVVILRIVGRPAWWIILAFIPVVNLAWLLIPFDLAKSFGKGTGFGLGLLVLGVIFGPVLAFGDATYQGPAAAEGGAAPATP